MKHRITRVLVPNEGNADDAKRAALNEAAALAVTTDPAGEVTILFETLNNVDTLSSVIGRYETKSFMKEKEMLIDGVKFNLQTVKGFALASESDVLLGIHLSANSGIRKMDDVIAASAIVFLPWLHDEGKEWKATWNPRCTSKDYDEVAGNTLDPTLESELERLPKQLGHPSDDDEMKKGLKKLRKEFPATEARLIRRWALRSGYNSADADKIMKWFK